MQIRQKKKKHDFYDFSLEHAVRALFEIKILHSSRRTDRDT
jgi:hypothetical protein